MTAEEKLKSLILNRYYSVREFTNEVGIPYTTMHSIFKRGIGNSSVTNVIKICKALGISADALADGEIVSVRERRSTPVNGRIEVKDVLDETKDILTHSRFMTLDGKAIDHNGIESIIDAMDVGVEIAKKKSR